MLELFHESIRVPNLPVTVLLLIVLLYWIINLIGIFDVEIFGHGSADMDFDHDGQVDGNSFFAKVFDFGDLPITIVFSFFVLFFWMGTILCNYYLGNSSMIFALLIYIPNFIGAFIIARIVSIPLAKAYTFLNNQTEEAQEGDFSGLVCIVSIEVSSESMGQGEINRNGDSIRVNLKSSTGKVIRKSEQALLIEYYPEKGYYLAEPYEQQR